MWLCSSQPLGFDVMERSPRNRPPRPRLHLASIPVLNAGTTVGGDLSRGEAKAFQVRLVSAQSLHLHVIPRGVAIGIECIDATHPKLSKRRYVTSPYTSEGPLSMYFVAQRTAD